MLRRDFILPHEDIFPFDEWRIVERRFNVARVPLLETIFALANGYMGMRGTLEEGAPVHEAGTFVNGFFETWPMVYPEDAFGLARTGQTMVSLPSVPTIHLYVDDDPLFLPEADLISYERALDMRAGMARRSLVWRTPAGRRVRLTSERMVSFPERHLAAVRLEVTLLDGDGPVALVSRIVPQEEPDPAVAAGDPRAARALPSGVLASEHAHAVGLRLTSGMRTRNSGQAVAMGFEHLVETECQHTTRARWDAGEGKVLVAVEGRHDMPIRLTKLIAVHTSRRTASERLLDRVGVTLDRARARGWDALAADQRAWMDDYWDRADVRVESDAPRAQQAIRWNLFQLAQAGARADGLGVPAKGLTGQAYEGHYFWDIETYALPFFVYTNPLVARNLLDARYRMLDHARARAREVNQKGALFPWRTISGEEASPFFEASTAAYHIDADITYAVRKYAQVTGDDAWLFERGAEIVVETARLWADLGFHSSRDGRFHIHGVTGPDEYTTIVNDNTFTNVMARLNLRYAVEVVERMRAEAPDALRLLVRRTGLADGELEDWGRAADAMYVPYDERLGINPQDDTFLDKEPWDFAGTPADRYPLLLHYHPLVIYRFQVLKQADVVMAMFLRDGDFPPEVKRRNFDYYDPLTTGDSSLSACVESIVAADVGYPAKALEYFGYAMMMDIGNLNGNADQGVHVASCGGVWMALVYGFAGLRQSNGRLSFTPRLPPGMHRLAFGVHVRGRRLGVDLTREASTYTLIEGDELTLLHRGDAVTVSAGKPVVVEEAVAVGDAGPA